MNLTRTASHSVQCKALASKSGRRIIVSFKEDFESREHIETEMGDAKMMKGIITREEVVELRTGKVTGEALYAKMIKDGRLPDPKVLS